MKKFCGRIAMLSAALLLLVGTSTVSAASKPKIDSFSKKTTDSLKIKIIYAKWASKKVDIVVSVRNKETDETTQKTFDDEKLGSSGSKTVQINDLTKGTKYSFKVKIRKHTNGSYSDWSNSESSKTKS